MFNESSLRNTRGFRSGIPVQDNLEWSLPDKEKREDDEKGEILTFRTLTETFFLSGVSEDIENREKGSE